MRLIIGGIAVIVLGYVWMIVNASVGYTKAWWWFRWSDFKLVLGLLHLAGAILIGLGVRQRSKIKQKRSGDDSRP